MNPYAHRLLSNGTVCYVFDGDGQLFIQLFRSTWRSLGYVVRREVLRYWAQFPQGPRIELIDGWAQHQPGLIARVDNRGQLVRFHAPYIDLMSDANVGYVITHELVHVLQWAIDYDRSSEELERDARKYALEWLGRKRRPAATRELLARIVADSTAQIGKP